MIGPEKLVDNVFVKALINCVQKLGRLGRRRVRAVAAQPRQNPETGPATHSTTPNLLNRTAEPAASNTTPSITLSTGPEFSTLQAVTVQAKTLRQYSAKLQAVSPVQSKDIQRSINQLEYARKKLLQCLTRLHSSVVETEYLHPGAPEFDEVRKTEEEITRTLRDNQDRIKVLKARRDNCPASEFHLTSAKLDHYRAAITAARNAAPESSGNPGRQALLEALIREHSVLELKLKTASHSQSVSRKEILALKHLPEQLVKRLKQHGVRTSLGKHKHIQADHANNQPWEIMTRPVHFHYAGRYHRFTETSIPASKTRLPQSALPDSEKDIPPDQGSFRHPYETAGISAHSATEVMHATNLNITRLINEEGKDIFSAVRHGVLSPYGHPPGSQERMDGALNRAEETALAALQLHPDKLKDALDGKHVELILTSNSLLTPDVFRHKLARDENDEQAMLQDQVKALRILAKRGTLPIRLPSGEIREVKIKLHVVPLNFGMNKFSQGKTSVATGGWGMSDRLNRQGLEALFGLDVVEPPESLAGAYLQRLQETDPSNPDIPLIKELISQIRKLYYQNRHHSTRGGAAKLASRVMVLTHMIGGTPLVNCKSGKDRTALAMTDAEWLMTRIRLTGRVPEPVRISPVDRQLFLEFALQGNHLNIQQLNSGAPGFKLDPMILASYIDNPETLAYLRGLGDAVLA